MVVEAMPEPVCSSSAARAASPVADDFGADLLPGVACDPTWSRRVNSAR